MAVKRTRWILFYKTVIVLLPVIVVVLYLAWDYIPSRLHMAVMRDDVEKVKYLINKGYEVNDELKAFGPSICPYWTPLKTAARNGNPRIVKMLLEAGANPENITDTKKTTGHNSWSAIHLAVQSDCNECLELLINYGASVDAPGNADVTALYQALDTNNILAVKILLNAGADPNATTGAPLDGNTAFVMALSNANSEVIKLLLDAGADCDVTVNRYGGKKIPFMEYLLEGTDLPNSVVNEIIEMCQSRSEGVTPNGEEE